MLLQLHQDSHVDHGLTARQLAHVMLKLSSPGYHDSVSAKLHAIHGGGPWIETLTLPDELGTVPCALFGPTMGDAPIPSALVTMKARPGRAYPSRMIVGSEMAGASIKLGDRRICTRRSVNTLTVIAGPHDGHDFVLYTAFGGPLAPKEPDDPTIQDHEREASVAFWAEHALAEVL